MLEDREKARKKEVICVDADKLCDIGQVPLFAWKGGVILIKVMLWVFLYFRCGDFIAFKGPITGMRVLSALGDMRLPAAWPEPRLMGSTDFRPPPCQLTAWGDA